MAVQRQLLKERANARHLELIRERKHTSDRHKMQTKQWEEVCACPVLNMQALCIKLYKSRVCHMAELMRHKGGITTKRLGSYTFDVCHFAPAKPGSVASLRGLAVFASCRESGCDTLHSIDSTSAILWLTLQVEEPSACSSLQIICG